MSAGSKKISPETPSPDFLYEGTPEMYRTRVSNGNLARFRGNFEPDSKYTRAKRIAEFAAYTGVSGPASIRRSKGVLRKTIWLVAWAAVWAACIWQVYMAVKKYFEYPINVIVSVRYDDQAEFPAVTICNMNPVRKSLYESIVKPMMHEQNMSSDIFEGTPKAVQFGDMQNNTAENMLRMENGETFAMNPESQYRKEVFSTLYNMELDLADLGHKIDHMVLDCTYQGIQCYPSDFHRFQHGQFGNCYSIRFNSSMFPSSSGPEYGLILTLYTEYEEYMDRISQSSGFKVEVHHKTVIPVPEDKGFTISPGFETAVGVKRLYVQRQGLPYNGTDCVKTSERDTYTNKSLYLDLETQLNITSVYSNAACTKSCYTRALIKYCDCVDPSVVTHNIVLSKIGRKIKSCNLGEPTTFKCVSNLIRNSSMCGDEVCPQACEQNLYLTSVTSSLWPTDKYLLATFDAYVERGSDTVMKFAKGAQFVQNCRLCNVGIG